jgi:RNA polymerase sigma factor (sigma-70 family)
MVALLEAVTPTTELIPSGASRVAATADPRLEEEEAALKRLVLQHEMGDDVSRIVVERVVPRLMTFLRRRYRSLPEEDAYDAAADALRVAIERRLEFDPARASNVRTWLYGIAVIKAADHLRKRGSVVPLDPETEPLWAAEARAHAASAGNGFSTGDDTQRNDPVTTERAEQIRAALLTLPTQQRKAALARYVDGLAPAEIDRQYGWKPNTAHVYLSIARKTIRRRLDPQDLDKSEHTKRAAR